MQHFGQWVRSERESRRMTATECGKMAEMTVSGWSNLERLTASPKTETVRKVGIVFDMTTEEVMLKAGLSSPRTDETELAHLVAVQVEKIPPSRRQEYRFMATKMLEALTAGFTSQPSA